MFADGVLFVLSKNSGVLWESGIFSDSPEIFQIPFAHFANRPFANYIWKESQVISKVFHSLKHDSWISKATVNTIWEVPERYNFPQNILTQSDFKDEHFYLTCQKFYIKWSFYCCSEFHQVRITFEVLNQINGTPCHVIWNEKMKSTEILPGIYKYVMKKYNLGRKLWGSFQMEMHSVQTRYFGFSWRSDTNIYADKSKRFAKYQKILVVTRPSILPNVKYFVISTKKKKQKFHFPRPCLLAPTGALIVMICY